MGEEGRMGEDRERRGEEKMGRGEGEESRGWERRGREGRCCLLVRRSEEKKKKENRERQKKKNGERGRVRCRKLETWILETWILLTFCRQSGAYPPTPSLELSFPPLSCLSTLS